MISKVTAQAAQYRDIFHHSEERNSDGTPTRCRVNGVCKVWKTRPNEYRLPVKQGMYGHGYITEENGGEWYQTEAAAVSAGIDAACDAICGEGTAARLRTSAANHSIVNSASAAAVSAAANVLGDMVEERGCGSWGAKQ